MYPLISFLPRYANGAQGTESELLPLWQESDEPTRQTSQPVTEMERGSQSTRSVTTVDPEKGLAHAFDVNPPLKPARNPPATTLLDYIPLFRLFAWIAHVITRRAHPKRYRRKKRRHDEYVESQIPLEIILILSKSVRSCVSSGLSADHTSFQKLFGLYVYIVRILDFASTLLFPLRVYA